MHSCPTRMGMEMKKLAFVLPLLPATSGSTQADPPAKHARLFRPDAVASVHEKPRYLPMSLRLLE